MSADPVPAFRELTPDTAVALPRSASNAWWGMATLIATEATLFAIFVSSYWFLRWQSPEGFPPPGFEEPKLMRPALMTALLLGGSVAAHLAERGIRANRPRRLKALLPVAAVLGAAFLGVQAWEYSDKLAQFQPGDHAYASLFYAITGFHGLHVLAGLILLAWVILGAWRGRYSPRRHLGVQIAVLYWHFVDVVWVILIVPSLYLSEAL